jgi:uronate dehydrogenase
VSRLLVTGAAGRIGTVLRAGLAPRYDQVRGFDLVAYPPEAPEEDQVLGDLRDAEQLVSAMQDVDAVVHLAGVPVEGPFDEVLEHNVRGTYHVLEAARRTGVRRVVFASTNHVIGFHPRSVRLDDTSPPRPDTYYGVSKLAGEGLASLYADKFGLETVSVRIGSCLQRPVERRHLWTWLSHGDAVRLFDACLSGPVSGHVVVYGVSANRRSWWDDATAAQLGYRPQDDAEAYLAEIEARDPWQDADPDDPAEQHQGGSFVGWDEAAYGPPTARGSA